MFLGEWARLQAAPSGDCGWHQQQQQQGKAQQQRHQSVDQFCWWKDVFRILL